MKIKLSRRLRLLGPAFGRSEWLEGRLAFSVSPTADYDDTDQPNGFPHAPRSSCSCAGCSFIVPAEIRTAPVVARAEFPLEETFKLHSLSTATKRIYLDFDGHFTDKTLWQTYFGHGPINTPAFSLDADYTQFSDLEKAAIQDVWARVAEDFAPFEIDVTTEDPGVDALVNSGGSDNSWGIRVVIGGSGAWLGGSAAGVAILGGFGDAKGAPAFAFADQFWKNNADQITGTVSHEVGHALGLDHDGPGYYPGHGSGQTGWGPIMGSTLDKNLTQWSRGEYRNANNQQDDLAIITGTDKTQHTPNGNGFGYRADDFANTLENAFSPTSDVTRGIIERNDDVDLFKFVSSGAIKATVKPIAAGANLDILADILDSNGLVLHTSNPIGQIDASFDVTVSPGTYYLRVQGTGEGDPQQTGYTKYGSLGQYTVTIQNVIPPPVVSVADVVVSEGDSGEKVVQFTIALSKPAVQPVSVKVATRDGTATAANEDFVPIAPAAQVVFAAGESSKQVEVRIKGDRWFEPDEDFSLVLSDASGVVIGDGEAMCTIDNDDLDVPVLSVADTLISEGNAGQKMARITVSLSKPSTDPVSVLLRTEDGTAEAADGDYVAVAAGTIVSFNPGQTSHFVDVPIVGDRTFEDDETFTVVLSDAQGAVIATEIAEVVIENDDRDPATLPRVTLLPAVAVETPNRRSFATFRLVISGELTEPVDLTYATQDGSASGRRDYKPARGALRILPGQTEALVSVAIVNDRLLEQDETFSLVVSAAAGGDTRVVPWTDPLAEQSGATVTAVILDDDSRFISVQSAVRVLSTGENAAFTIALRRMAGFGDALPSISGLEGLPASYLASMAEGIRFSARYSLSYEPAKRGGPGGARPTIQTGAAEFGYFGDGNGGLQSRSASDMELVARQVPIAGTVSARLLSASNARVRQGVATLSARPAMSAAFAAIGSSPRAARHRTR